MKRPRFAWVGGVVVLAVGVAASCTIFDGLDAGVAMDAGDAAPAPDANLADQGLPPGEQPGFLSLSNAVAFCSNAFACPNLAASTEFSVDVPVDPNHFSSCVDWLAGPLPSDRNGPTVAAVVLECAAAATTCNAAGGCMWDEVITAGDPRCAGKDAGKAGSCGDSNASVYYCNSNPGIVHCGNAYFAAGSTCLYDDAGTPFCTSLPCGSQQCVGDLLSYCGVDGLQYSQNCAMGGFTCGLDSTENYDDCLTNGAAKRCTSLALNCAGTTVALCDSIYVSDYDCAAYGGTCDQTGFPRCKRPTESCTPQDGDIDVCTGTTIALCVGGQKASFDCASIGKTCAAASGGQSAHCQ
jgi:hypothetical protein